MLAGIHDRLEGRVKTQQGRPHATVQSSLISLGASQPEEDDDYIDRTQQSKFKLVKKPTSGMEL